MSTLCYIKWARRVSTGVVQLICNQKVGGSNPSPGTTDKSTAAPRYAPGRKSASATAGVISNAIARDGAGLPPIPLPPRGAAMSRRVKDGMARDRRCQSSRGKKPASASRRPLRCMPRRSLPLAVPCAAWLLAKIASSETASVASDRGPNDERRQGPIEATVKHQVEVAATELSWQPAPHRDQMEQFLKTVRAA